MLCSKSIHQWVSKEDYLSDFCPLKIVFAFLCDNNLKSDFYIFHMKIFGLWTQRCLIHCLWKLALYDNYHVRMWVVYVAVFTDINCDYRST